MKVRKNKMGGGKKKNVTRRSSSARIVLSDRISIGGNFNVVENDQEAAILISVIAANAGKSAASEAKALNMPKVYANAAKVIIETADGKKTVVATADNIPGKKYYKKYNPGTIMHANNK